MVGVRPSIQVGVLWTAVFCTSRVIWSLLTYLALVDLSIAQKPRELGSYSPNSTKPYHQTGLRLDFFEQSSLTGIHIHDVKIFAYLTIASPRILGTLVGEKYAITANMPSYLSEVVVYSPELKHKFEVGMRRLSLAPEVLRSNLQDIQLPRRLRAPIVENRDQISTGKVGKILYENFNE